MSVNVNDKSGLVESFTPGYEGCGCGNRRYYTKAEIDEMFQNVLDPEQIEKIVKEVVDEYVTSEEFSQVIISIIGEDYYTKAQIDTILEGYATKAWTTGDTDTRVSTAIASETARTEDVYAKKTDVPSLDGYATTGWVDSQNYLKDITITINGDPIHNNGEVIIQGGGGEPVDISGKLDTTAFTQAMQSETARTENTYAKKSDLDGKVDTSAFTAYTATTKECCDYVKGEIDDIWAIIATLTGDTPTPPGPEPPTPTPSQYVGEYLTIEALESGNFKVRHGNGVEYSVNDGEWSGTTENMTIPLTTGDKVRFRSDYRDQDGAYLFTGNTMSFNVYGNVMSLIYYDNFSGQTQTPEWGDFMKMFQDSTGLVYATNLVIPTSLGTSSCQDMFSGCTSLIGAPELPATSLGNNCYAGMFAGCTSLTDAPNLPATVLTEQCYGYMFAGCTALTGAPIMSATTLASGCCVGMFQGCTSLETAPVLLAETGAIECYNTMFANCSSLNYIKCLLDDNGETGELTSLWISGVAASGTFVKKPNSVWYSGAMGTGIPSGWTVVDNN